MFYLFPKVSPSLCFSRENSKRKLTFFPCPIPQKCCSRKAWATIEASPCPNLPSASPTPIPPQQYRTLVKTEAIYVMIKTIFRSHIVNPRSSTSFSHGS